MKNVEMRKQKEIEHANKLKILLENTPDQEKVAGNKKFYSITRASQQYVNSQIIKIISPGKKFLDYCCGDGATSIWMARQGADVCGIDISDVSIRIARQKAARACLQRKPHFAVMDAERLLFADNSFDVVFCGGVLHHLDIAMAYKELARVLKPNGRIICGEPLAYNPVFQIYRKLTPQLRTEWEAEHILTKKMIFLAKDYFDAIDVKFFHLVTLLAVPFRHTPIFNFVLSVCEAIDALLLKIPLIKWLAWQTVFVLSDPKKNGKKTV
jgi:ubiquinone/menaquinone biosynthesis C-methylase UbiE